MLSFISYIIYLIITFWIFRVLIFYIVPILIVFILIVIAVSIFKYMARSKVNEDNIESYNIKNDKINYKTKEQSEENSTIITLDEDDYEVKTEEN